MADTPTPQPAPQEVAARPAVAALFPNGELCSVTVPEWCAKQRLPDPDAFARRYPGTTGARAVLLDARALQAAQEREAELREALEIFAFRRDQEGNAHCRNCGHPNAHYQGCMVGRALTPSAPAAQGQEP